MIETSTDAVAVDSPLLTYAEAGRYLRKSARFVRELVYAGELSIRRIGRTPYVHVADLDAFIAGQVEVGESARRPEMTPAHKLKVSA
ncbi:MULTISPECIES: helix-turn-helix domain-containing protein [Mycobacteriaceae]|uniref:helix-turn-helix domain-containing protein n=1 Tax=Mycobacteroides abscessus TaxID=36809 RepID=UPI0013000C1E|nr:helix-turn-helix domain-containing protein [Mycobacteroides abscessus]